jgi:hypothetical protein
MVRVTFFVGAGYRVKATEKRKRGAGKGRKERVGRPLVDRDDRR